MTDQPQVPRDLDIKDTAAVTAENISDAACIDLVQEIDDGDYRLNDWEIDFIDNMIVQETFSLKQKAVIYKMAFRLHLI
jgi:hypothetical protein